MGKFKEIAEVMLRVAREEGIKSPQIPEIIGNIIGENLIEGNVNCYPGREGKQCFNLAFFISLSGKLKNGPGHYGFDQILELLIKHVQGDCSDETRHVVIITDSWTAQGYEKWKGNIETIVKNGVKLEIYLISYLGIATILDV
jgi:hypothetical protein